MSDDFAATDLKEESSSRTRHAAERFTPGSVIAGRYRVIALLGEGGMGEVYRADDIKLGQRVALKFVPEELARNPSALERLYSEVRIGRQIAHPNVCRLYDIVESEGSHFITMEYVDGEDLASLLRRIGRLPSDKALSLARAICSGLAAAHDRGFIHRDLKPANIMIDGQGHARITDFGLAIVSGDDVHRGDQAGTIAYMAPEQLDGADATIRSDIYALGLVLYEMFTGRRVFDGRRVDEIRKQHATSKSRPANIVAGMDPGVERIILRCLDENPGSRPASVHAVIAAFPGGDPLQAAVDAGETPSPEMVAAAEQSKELTLARAWTLLCSVAVLLVLATLSRQTSTVEGYAPRAKGREVLADRAHDVIAALSGTRDVADRSFRYFPNTDWLVKLANDSNANPGRALSREWPPAIFFYYRESPVAMVPFDTLGRVTKNDPPVDVAGMASVTLDGAGRLRTFDRVPPVSSAPVPREADWSRAFQEAGLDTRAFRASVPRVTPPHGFDRQAAWEGSYPGTRIPIRVEAASHGGVPVYFEIFEPWQRSAGSESYALDDPGRTPITVAIICALIGGAIVARRNVRVGRSDTRGATRVALALALIYLGAQLCVMDHVPILVAEWDMLTDVIAVSLWVALEGWIYYLAVEPYIRRRWPHVLIAWTRMVSGRFRDPLVGRDVLLGVAAGLAAVTVATAWPLIREVLRLKALPLESALWRVGMDRAIGFGYAVGYSTFRAVIYALGWVTLLVIVRMLVRSDRPATIIWLLLGAAAVTSATSPAFTFLVALVYLTAFALAFRYGGLLAMVVAEFVFFLVQQSPMTFDMAQFFAARSVAVSVLILAIAGWAFHVAIAGKPILGGVIHEE